MEIIDTSRLDLAVKTKAECKVELTEARWNGQFRCPKCKHQKGYWINSRALFECANRACRKQTSATAGTQYHRARDLESLWVILKENASNIVLKAGAIRAKTGISYSSARKMIQKYGSTKPWSITWFPTEERAAATSAANQLADTLTTDSPTSEIFPLSLKVKRKSEAHSPPVKFAFREASIEFYFRQLAALICPELKLSFSWNHFSECRPRGAAPLSVLR